MADGHAARGLFLVVLILAGCGPRAQAERGHPVVPNTRPGIHWRAIAGVSMGGYGAAYLGTRYLELFDGVALMGGPYDLDQVLDHFYHQVLGGFLPEEAAQTFGYDRLNMGIDASTFERDGYVDLFQDLTLVAGNAALYNPDNSYWPPGITVADEAAQARARSCTDPWRLDDFYDAQYNDPAAPYCADYPGAISPNARGLWPVITFCESRGRLAPPFAYPDTAAADLPVEVALAVDCNGNGRRDPGEPVIRQFWEPWWDVGVDGLPSTAEAGYDPLRNPDPAGDDYDPFANPEGTEGNGRYDAGERYRDAGLDGLPGVSNLVDDPFEGNGRFDLNPNVANYQRRNPAACVRAAAVTALNATRFYVEAGVKDPFAFDASAERFAGALAARGLPVVRVTGFPRLAELAGDGDLTRVRFTRLGAPNLLLLYGDPDLSWTEAYLRGGDGGHVGTPGQLVERLVTVFLYLGQLWKLPPQPVPFAVPGYELIRYRSELLGGAEREVAVALPPGYEPGSTRRYPVVYFLHGHGMTPEGTAQAGAVVQLLMAQGRIPPFFVVYPDGRVVRKRRGSFWVNHADTSGQDPYPYADALIQEVIPLVESRYPVLADPSEVEGLAHDEGCPVAP